jgi:hypothetical protein
MIFEVHARARADRFGDLAALEHLAQNELDYLAKVPEIVDDETGLALDCAFDAETG